MRILSRTIFGEITLSALFGTVLFTFVLFLQQISHLFERLIRSSAPPQTVGYLFALLLPYVLTFTIPVGVLVGVLMTLSRMSSDGEITAMRAGGIPGRRVLWPVMSFALIGAMLAGAATFWLTPLAIRQRYKVINKLAAAELTAEIQPRVFEEGFPNTILYVSDVGNPGTTVRWKNVFLANTAPPAERKGGSRESGEGPQITVASEAIAVPDVARNRIQLSLVNGSTHEAGKTSVEYYTTSFPTGDQILEAEKRGEVRPRIPFTEMDTGPLYRVIRGSIDARIEFYQRVVLPPACIFFALIGIPLGVSSRKAGKSSAFVLTVLIAFLYWMGLIGLIGLARQGTVPVGLALWIPNIVIGAIGLFLLMKLERPGDRDIIGAVQDWFRRSYRELRGHVPDGPVAPLPVRRSAKFFVVPQLVDSYVLASFLFYFVLLLASFVLMTHVYNFFELLSDVVKNHVAMSVVAKYLFFLTPKLIYDSTPMSVLVAVLVTFGILTKNNEITAFKACGISLYRLSIPILLASLCLSALLFAFDHYYIPGANVIQDALRNQIKGRPAQTFLHPDRKWISGEGSRIFYYRYFEPAEGMMVGVNVYKLAQGPFRLERHISAERARWEPAMNTWIFQNGWAREFSHGKVVFQNFQGGTATFPEIVEPPGYFLKEDVQEKQMNFLQLSTYIKELRQSGFDTVHLQVQFYKKFSVPIFALIMAIISVPFAFATGNRGAMAGIGVSFGIAIAYWSISALFEQIGNVSQLPPALAAWSPDAVFSLAGLYFYARMRT
jgi:LPS export ABC transporter permease LptG/LPS export ABC transporter permease LptF